jgi:hypothetical protein
LQKHLVPQGMALVQGMVLVALVQGKLALPLMQALVLPLVLPLADLVPLLLLWVLALVPQQVQAV